MNLVIFGANGGIGKYVVEQGIAAGHCVTAVARRPETMTLRHENLRVLRGDVLDPASVAAAVTGQDAVVSAVGIAKSAPTTVYSDGAANMLRTMETAGVRRFFCVSATGLNPGPFFQRLIAKPLLWYFFGDMYADLVRMETVVKASPLDWTIVRPPRLTDALRTGNYQIMVNRQFTGGGFTIPRADVADYILTHLTDSLAFRAVVEVAY